MAPRLQEFLSGNEKWITGIIVPVATVVVSMIFAALIASKTAKEELTAKFAVGHVVADYIAYRFFHMMTETTSATGGIKLTNDGRPKLTDCSKKAMYRSVIKEMRAEMTQLLKNPILVKKDEMILTIAAIQNEIAKELPTDHCSVSREVVYHMCVFVPAMEARMLAGKDGGAEIGRRRPRTKRNQAARMAASPRTVRYSAMKETCGKVRARKRVDKADRFLRHRTEAIIKATDDSLNRVREEVRTVLQEVEEVLKAISPSSK